MILIAGKRVSSLLWEHGSLAGQSRFDICNNRCIALSHLGPPLMVQAPSYERTQALHNSTDYLGEPIISLRVARGNLARRGIEHASSTSTSGCGIWTYIWAASVG